MDSIENTISRHYTGNARLPLRGKLPWEYGMLDQTEFRCNSTKLLRHLVALGYLKQEKLHCCVYGEAGYKQIIREFSNPDPPIYAYEQVCDLPFWIVDFA